MGRMVLQAAERNRVEKIKLEWLISGTALLWTEPWGLNNCTLILSCYFVTVVIVCMFESEIDNNINKLTTRQYNQGRIQDFTTGGAVFLASLQSFPLPWKRGSGGPPPENFEILHCCRWVLAHFLSKKWGWWLEGFFVRNYWKFIL